MAKTRARKPTPKVVEESLPVVEIAKPSELLVRVKRLSDGAKLPIYATAKSAGVDLYAMDKMVIPSQGHALVSTGLAVEIPEGYEMQIRPRSGLALLGVTIPNAPGTIDSDYRGEVKVILRNLGAFSFTVEPGMRIAQAVVAPVTKVRFIEVEELTDTERGDGGFGSTEK